MNLCLFLLPCSTTTGPYSQHIGKNANLEFDIMFFVMKYVENVPIKEYAYKGEVFIETEEEYELLNYC